MRARVPVVRIVAALVAVVSLAPPCSSPARAAGADPSSATLACLDAHEKGQRSRNAGRTGEARRQLVACARPGCPPLVERDCSTLLAELEHEQPTLLLEARDARGNETLVIHVFVDGVRVDEREGLAVPVDPGEHVLRIDLPGHAPLEQRVVARTGEKERRIVFAVTEPPAGASERVAAVSASPPTAAWVFSGVALAGVASFTYFAVSGKALERDDAGSCAPDCSASQVSSVRNRYLAADVSLGVAAASTAAAIYFFAHRPAPSRVAFSAAPSLHGAAARLEVSF